MKNLHFQRAGRAVERANKNPSKHTGVKKKVKIALKRVDVMLETLKSTVEFFYKTGGTLEAMTLF